MTTIRKFLSFGALAAVLALAGCQMGGPLQRPNASLQSQGVEGQWVGTDGVAVSTLQNGVFESHSADTGELLTRGTYRHTDSRTIELSFYSLRSQQYTSAACLQVTPDRMNCTLANGTKFVLVRNRGSA